MATRKGYTKEFKEGAVWLVTDQRYKRAEAARNLEINAGILGRWVREYRADKAEAFRGNGRRTEEQEGSWPWLLSPAA